MTKKLTGGIELYHFEELKRDLDVHESTLRRYLRSGKLRGQKIGRKYWISIDSLRSFVNAEKQGEEGELRHAKN